MTTPSTAERPTRLRFIRDDIAYILPIAVFLALTWVGGQWESLYPLSYVLKTLIVAGLLVTLWGHFTRIRWHYWWLGIIVGVVGIAQWIVMERALLAWWPDYPRLATAEPFDPYEHFASVWMMWGFILIRWAGASLLVPVMEELFWRDFLWRTIIAPNDFKMAEIGEWDPKAFFIVAIIFGAGVHVEWLTAIVYGLIIGGLLLYTRSLGACIIAHGVSNFLLGLYVLVYQDWRFW